MAALAVAAVVGFLAFPGTSLAQLDSKIYPGSLCKPAASWIDYNTEGGGYTTFVQYYAARVGVACPVVRDQVLGTSNATVFMSVYDSSSTGFVWCGLYSVDHLGGSTSYGTASTTAIFVGKTYLNATVPTKSSWYSTLSLECDLDQNAKIYVYEVDETVQTE